MWVQTANPPKNANQRRTPTVVLDRTQSLIFSCQIGICLKFVGPVTGYESNCEFTLYSLSLDTRVESYGSRVGREYPPKPKHVNNKNNLLPVLQRSTCLSIV